MGRPAGRSIASAQADLRPGPAARGPGPRRRADGPAERRRRRLAADGDSELAIEGPGEVDVGDVAVFEMQGQQVDDWVWIMPDGTLIPGSAQVSLEASTPGVAPVTLIGTSRSGVTLEVVHDLRAIEQ